MAAEQNYMPSSQFAVPMLPNTYANPSLSSRIGQSIQSGSSIMNSSAIPSTSSVQYPIQNGNNTSNTAAGVIRRRRFSTAKIQPTRIKKVMQSDEEIGRMVQSVPVSIGRAMEHFAEKFLQAAADATQFSNSKTLTPQHMKQAMLANPHFRFLETVLKDIAAPQITADVSMARTALSLKEQQQMTEQQNSEMASVILANAQMQLKQFQQQAEMTQHLPMQPVLNGHNFEMSEGVPMSPVTPTTQLAGVMELLQCASQSQMQNQPQIKMNGLKRTSVDENPEDKPKRGRPKKKKTDKLVDDALYEEASQNVEKEEKDRQMMPPPSLPIGIPR